jgi:hypothetical protein
VQDRIPGRPQLRVIQGGLGNPEPPPEAPPSTRSVLRGLWAGALATVTLLVLSTLMGGSPLERLMAGSQSLPVYLRAVAWLAQLAMGTVLGALFLLTLREGQRWADRPWRIPWALAFGLLAWTPLQALSALRDHAETAAGAPSLGIITWAPFLAYGVVLALVLESTTEPRTRPVRRYTPRLMSIPGLRKESGQRRPWRLGGGPPARPRLV